ncbi:hypothetical protein HDZ31DRAFT_49778, partial [Schizophyllum fasciatum]
QPQRYLKVTHHPHANLPPTIIPLDSPMPQVPSGTEVPHIVKPFAPFRSLADFEFVEHVVNTKASKPQIQNLLDAITNRWIPDDAKAILDAHGARATSVTYRTVSNVEKSMEYARQYTIQFRESDVTAMLRGEERSFRLIYRDIWEFIVSLAQDPMLASDIMWHSAAKSLHDAFGEQPVIDQPNTASCWHDVDDILPDCDPYPHCWAPIHLWLDEGRVRGLSLGI